MTFERVVLVGFMGAGKTRVGRRLARLLSWRFLDMDALVEAEAGATVQKIFETQGEAAFREAERRVAERLLLEKHAVVAAGGGAFAQPDTRRLLARDAFTVFLRCDLETLLKRIGDGRGRPLATNRGIMAALLAARTPHYERALCHVDASREDARMLAARIHHAFMKSQERPAE